MGGTAELKGPDLEKDGLASAELAEGATLAGHAQGEPVMVTRQGGEVLAVGASCTHYGGPLAEGMVENGRVHCPWHHACFDLRTGEAHGPALNAIPCWKVEARGERLYVVGKRAPASPKAPSTSVSRVVVVGAGAAGNYAAETLRRLGFAGSVILVGADEAGPVDRPNLSKDYLAGTAPEEWIPLRPREFYDEQKIALRLGEPARAIDVAKKTVTLASGEPIAYDALLLATGADPVKLPLPGADRPHVRTLRTLGDSRALIAAAEKAKRAVVIGASFIGLEVAASLRARGLEVHVVAPEARPLERVLGTAVGDWLRRVHEEHGVVFHLGTKPKAFGEADVELEDGSRVACDLVAVGVGVRPSVALAQAAGLKVDNGIVVDERLRASAAGVWAAGDVARWFDARTKRHVRVEHWMLAERHGEAAARSILGDERPFLDVPFFWSAHYDAVVNYAGHVEKVESVQVAGDLAKRDAIVAYREGREIRAVATVGRDHACLEASVALAKNDQPALERLIK